MTGKLNQCKTSQEVFKVMNAYLNSNKINNKWSNILQKRLKAETNFHKSLQMAYNFILNQEHPVEKDIFKVVPYKGSSIRGMEVHSCGHR